MRFPEVAFLLVASLTLTACTPDNQPPVPVTVAEVIDGDTIVIISAHGTEQVRLLGIDTPETVDPSRPVQCYGTEASERLNVLLPVGTVVRLERDVEARDKYGRLLSYIFRAGDDLFVNEVMLEEGFADLSIYSPNQAYEARLRDAFTSARTASAGLWSACGGADVPLQPWQYE